MWEKTEIEIEGMHPEYKLHRYTYDDDYRYTLQWKNKDVHGIANKDMKNPIERIVKPMIAAMDTERKYGG